MEIKINGESRIIDKEFDNLALLFEHLLDNELPEHTIIDKIKLDDEWHEQFTEEYLLNTVPKDMSIEVTTISLDALKSKTVTNSLAYLNGIESKLESISSLFREGQETEAHQALKRIIDSLNTLLTFLDSFAGTEKEQLFKDITEKFKELVDAQKAGDIGLIADIIEYEFPEVTTKMRELFESI